MEMLRIPAALVQDLSNWGRRWKLSACALLLCLLAVGVLHRETLGVMVGVWSSSETYTHAFVVPLISLWLIWRLREPLRATLPQPCWWVLLPMLLFEGLWVVANLMLVNVATHFAVVGLMVLCVPLVLGVQVARVILFPLGFAFFAVPFGDFLIPWLMETTADFTVAALSLTGIPVYREGQQFIIPTGSWSVVEACSGIRYLIASVMVGTLFAYLNYNTMWKRWAFVAVAFVLPVLANWGRAYMIVMLGHLSNNKLAVGVDHLIYGWVFFGVVIMIMFAVGARWAEPEADLTAAAAGPAGRPSHGVAAICMAAMAGVAVTALGPAASWGLTWADQQAAAPKLVLPEAMAGESAQAGSQRSQMAWAPHFQEPSAAGHRVYGSAERAVGLHVAYFRAQTYRSKLVNSMHTVVQVDDSTWNLQGVPDLSLPWQSQTLRLPVQKLQRPPSVAQGPTEAIVVTQFYWVDGAFTESATRAKLLGAMARLSGRGDDGAVVMAYTWGSDVPALRQRLQSFLNGGLKDLDRSLGSVRDQR